MIKSCLTILSRACLFLMLDKRFPTRESVGEYETSVCDHQLKLVLSCGTVYYAVQGGFNF